MSLGVPVLFLLVCYQHVVMAQTTHTVYFEGSHNELHIYKIHGSKPGKTLMLIGGIQGDEPGGFLAADLYADFALEKGNMIVVPRANFPSILKQARQVNEDMNRRFAADNDVSYEDRVVKILKKLIGESDLLLNLHEGSGFYSPKWVSQQKNPSRFGQSIIADTSVFRDSKNGITINLKSMAERVIEGVNKRIKDTSHHFHFNDHRTCETDSINKEQRKSATFYALYTCGVPAFGVESAKSLPLEQKVRQHVFAVNGFMDLLGIIPENPAFYLKKPLLQYLVVSVNGGIPVVVKNQQRLGITSGDSVEIVDIKANYTRGLSVDIIGVGSAFNDMHNNIPINHEVRVVAKKDFYPCGSIYLEFREKNLEKIQQLTVLDSGNSRELLHYKLKINGVRKLVKNYEHVKIARGDSLVIEDIVTAGEDPSLYIVNFKGFVGNSFKNDGEDRGYIIDTGESVLLKRYSLDKKGRHYYVLTTLYEEEVGRLYIDF